MFANSSLVSYDKANFDKTSKDILYNSNVVTSQDASRYERRKKEDSAENHKEPKIMNRAHSSCLRYLILSIFSHLFSLHASSDVTALE